TVPDLSSFSSLQVLRLESNELNGTLHEGIGQLSNLRELRLGNNSLEGLISEAHFSKLSMLLTLDLSHNSLVFNISNEWLPPFDLMFIKLASCILRPDFPKWLQTEHNMNWVDISEAEITGTVPNWFWEFLPMLSKLNLSHNHINGKIENLPLIPHKSALQIDLSSNSFEGNIPKCISNLSAMASQANLKVDIFYAYDDYYDDFDGGNIFGVNADSASLIWKGKLSKYRSTLGLLRSIDFSSNRLNGEIPSEMMSLVGLISLNISRNKLVGEIPQGIGQLKSLDFLDLSRNQLSGRIPLQLSQVDLLGVLDISYNDLSGQIPLGTQLQTRDASAYIGNPKLCGAPLNKTCLIPDQNQVDEDLITKNNYLLRGSTLLWQWDLLWGFGEFAAH
ncbi:hypothetical protein PIB30_064896, partial [Stylosanthes scabra]|nr:hypothetical protein [Stylosanthes scabra]